MLGAVGQRIVVRIGPKWYLGARTRAEELVDNISSLERNHSTAKLTLSYSRKIVVANKGATTDAKHAQKKRGKDDLDAKK
jgi:hypothetical protein